MPTDVFRLSIWLNYLCSTLNPILYTLSSPHVRSALRGYCHLLKGRLCPPLRLIGRLPGSAHKNSNRLV